MWIIWVLYVCMYPDFTIPNAYWISDIAARNPCGTTSTSLAEAITMTRRASVMPPSQVISWSPEFVDPKLLWSEKTGLWKYILKWTYHGLWSWTHLKLEMSWCQTHLVQSSRSNKLSAKKKSDSMDTVITNQEIPRELSHYGTPQI